MVEICVRITALLTFYMHLNDIHKSFQEGIARLEKRRRWEPKDKQQTLDELEKFQTEAREKRLAMWEYGDIASDDEDTVPLARKGAGKR